MVRDGASLRDKLARSTYSAHPFASRRLSALRAVTRRAISAAARSGSRARCPSPTVISTTNPSPLSAAVLRQSRSAFPTSLSIHHSRFAVFRLARSTRIPCSTNARACQKSPSTNTARRALAKQSRDSQVDHCGIDDSVAHASSKPVEALRLQREIVSRANCRHNARHYPWVARDVRLRSCGANAIARHRRLRNQLAKNQGIGNNASRMHQICSCFSGNPESDHRGLRRRRRRGKQLIQSQFFASGERRHCDPHLFLGFHELKGRRQRRACMEARRTFDRLRS